jgi:hypothetical protein
VAQNHWKETEVTTTTRSNAAQLTIKQLDAETICVPILGTAPLISHNWSAKARQAMLDNMQGRKSPKTAKDPQAEYESSLYRIFKEAPARVPARRTTAGAQRRSGVTARTTKTETVEAYGFPVIAFKAATVSAAAFYDKSVTKVALRQMLFFKGILTKADHQELVEVCGEPEMREDPVKVGISGHDLRYRAQFWPWTAELTVTYVRSTIDRASVVSLIDAGGLGVGVGEWRPERDGAFGTYRIDADRKVRIL